MPFFSYVCMYTYIHITYIYDAYMSIHIFWLNHKMFSSLSASVPLVLLWSVTSVSWSFLTQALFYPPTRLKLKSVFIEEIKNTPHIIYLRDWRYTAEQSALFIIGHHQPLAKGQPLYKVIILEQSTLDICTYVILGMGGGGGIKDLN